MSSRILICLLAFTFGFAGYAAAHCGKCGVGEPAAAVQAEESHGNNCLCGMHMNAGDGVAVEHEGKTYQFCSLACAEMFKKDPTASLEKMSAMDHKMEMMEGKMEGMQEGMEGMEEKKMRE